ncbi:hypothetical protein FAI40_04070 [Acetobacteraceae bacterium]|nr:hypothetical protein FAI40_04070 [Acetobacteraceae bacterium]
MRFFQKILLFSPLLLAMSACGDFYNQPFINRVQDERFVFEQLNETVRFSLKNPWLPLDLAEDVVKKEGEIEDRLKALDKVVLKYNATGINDDDFSMKYVPKDADRESKAVKRLLEDYRIEVTRTLKEFGNAGATGLPIDFGGVWGEDNGPVKHKAVQEGWGRVLLQDSPSMQNLPPRPWDEGVGTQARLQAKAAKHQEAGESWGNAFPDALKRNTQTPDASADAPNDSDSLSQQHGPQRGTDANDQNALQHTSQTATALPQKQGK